MGAVYSNNTLKNNEKEERRTIRSKYMSNNHYDHVMCRHGSP
jgi:hypothetical protein